MKADDFNTSQNPYLQHAGATPLLDRKSEVRLATQLLVARQAIQRLTLALPESCREFVLAGEPSRSNPAAPWPLSRLEGFICKLGHFTTQFPDAEAAAALCEIRVHKISLDDARESLTLANLRLVVHIASKYRNTGLPLMDLVQEGNLGLLTAVERFDHELGNRFSTYAAWWIRQGIQGGIAEKSRTIRIPAQVGEEMRRVEHAARELSQDLGRAATPSEVASKLSMPVKAVDHALSIVREPLALEGAVGDREGCDVAKIVPDAGAPSPFHVAWERERKRRVEGALRELDPREATIVRMRFGMGREAAGTLAQIGARLRLSRERVRQIEAVALAKIKASTLCRGLAESKA